MQQANFKTLRREVINSSARMLPLQREQLQVYRMAERVPPGLEGYQPRWEPISAVLGARQTIQLRVDLMRDFHLLAILGSATTNTVGGFRGQLYDVLKKRRLADRGVLFPNLGGASSGAFFLRDPYPFDLDKSQVLALLQNMEAVTNTIQLVLYGVVAPFEGTLTR